MAGIRKRVSGLWVSDDYTIMKTDTDTITTLPAVLYPTGSTATIGLKGNTVQNGTPTPTNPVDVVGVGTLDSTAYKISISSANTTTPVNLSEVQSTRQIQKLVLTGGESWTVYDSSSNPYSLHQFTLQSAVNSVQYSSCYSNIVPYGMTSNNRNAAPYGCYTTTNGTRISFQMAGSAADFPDTTTWKTYLQQQYANGTPVCVWYVLAIETTGTVNEPLMRIGAYADEVSNISIPVTAGGDTLSVGTTLQPSEVTVNYKGWHPVSAVHERDNGAWT